MKLTTRLGEIQKTNNVYKIVGVLIVTWVIKAISILTEPDTISEDEDIKIATEETTHEETTQAYFLAVPEDAVIVGSPIEESTTEEITTEEQTTVPEPKKYVDLSEEELHALACLIWLEGRGESIESQEAIASVVINRYTTEPNRYETLFDVIYAPSQFSPAKYVSSTTPTQIQIDIANKIATEGPTIPEYVTYFRADYYHKWKDHKPYCQIDKTYFSYDIALKQKLEGANK